MSSTPWYSGRPLDKVYSHLRDASPVFTFTRLFPYRWTMCCTCPMCSMPLVAATFASCVALCTFSLRELVTAPARRSKLSSRPGVTEGVFLTITLGSSTLGRPRNAHRSLSLHQNLQLGGLVMPTAAYHYIKIFN